MDNTSPTTLQKNVNTAMSTIQVARLFPIAAHAASGLLAASTIAQTPSTIGATARTARQQDDDELGRTDVHGSEVSTPVTCGRAEPHRAAAPVTDRCYFASSASMAATSDGSSGPTAGANRATTVPSLPMRNFSKFQSTSGSSVGVMP